MIANEFNNYFVQIGPQLASNITCTISPMSYVNYVMNSIVVPDITTTEVRKIILSLKNSSPGWDEIPASIAKRCVNNYIEPLTHIINQSLKEGVFPSEMKLARIVPIYKCGDSSNISNYRPISVLSFFSKVFEKIMYNIVIDFMDNNNAIYKYQFGFRQKHSTQQAIITLVNKITTCLNSGDLVIGVFLDLKKAFDTVDHNILLKKLYAYGIRGIALKWFESYLTDRSQYVTFDGIRSDTQTIKCGVPQGSILGPLLFVIYMNDICNVSNLLFTVLYADDTSVLLSGKDLADLIRCLNIELQLLSTWLKANKLSLNAQKTNYIIFHRARLKIDDTLLNSIYMNGSVINCTMSLKYLGVILDSKMSWIQHIAYVKNKISKGIGIMYKARRYLNKKSLVNLYHSYVYPYLIYCIESWGNAARCHLDPLFILQKRIIRIITYSNYDVSTVFIFKDLNVLPLHKLVQNRIVVIM